MCEKSTTGWKKGLTSILEELDPDQYEKTLEYLDKIPKSRKNQCRVQMAQTIIEYYGEDESILKVKYIMEEIPRRDRKVQDQLLPLVEKLEEKLGKKRKCGTDPESEVDQDSPAGSKKKKTTVDPDDDDIKTGTKRKSGTCSTPEEKKRMSSDGFEKNHVVSDSDSSGDETQDGDPESLQPEKKTEVPSWIIQIESLKVSGNPNGKVVRGKVVQKSGLRSYETKKKEKKFFFHLGVADETDCIKVMVYGKGRFQRYEEGQFYLFKDVIIEEVKDELIMKVINNNNNEVSKTSKIEVPENLELQAQILIYSQRPVCSIEKIQSSDERTSVSVEGTVTVINSVEQVKLKRKKENIQKFQLEDETGSIWITLWRRDTQQLRGTSVGDLVRVINLRTNLYKKEVSLNSTDLTRIYKVQAAAVQNVTMQITGVIKCGKMESKLDVVINNQVNTFIIASPLLAKVLGIKSKGNFEDKVLDKIPFSAEGEIKGEKIRDIKAAKEI